MLHLHRQHALNTRLDWREHEGWAVHGSEDTALRLGNRRVSDDPGAHWHAEALFLAAVETATFGAFQAYAHSQGLHVKAYSSSATALVGLCSSGKSELTVITVRPVVTLAFEAEEAAARALFAQLPALCPVLSSLGELVRIEPTLHFAPLFGDVGGAR